MRMTEVPARFERGQLLHDLAAGGRVQVAGRLVGHDDGGLGRNRAGDGDALLLAAGHLGRAVVHAVGQAHLLECGAHERTALAAGQAAVDKRQLNVFKGSQCRDEVESLEDEADLAVADAGQGRRPHVADRLAAQAVDAVGRDIQAAQDVHQRGLARARLAQDAQELPEWDRQRNVIQRAHLVFPALIVDFA